MSFENISQTKKMLRRILKDKLSPLTEEVVAQQSRRAQEMLIAHSQYQRAKCISVYLAMPRGEARTDMIVQDALSSGKQVFVPYIYQMPTAAQDAVAASGDGKDSRSRIKRRAMEMLRLQSLADWEGLERDSWGIPSLNENTLDDRENAKGGTGLQTNENSSKGIGKAGAEADATAAGLDLMVVPGVAFDEGFNRLGHGAGFYDKYLTDFCAGETRPKPFLVGMCLAEQFQTGQADIPMTSHDWRMDAIVVGDGRMVESGLSNDSS